MSRLRFVLLVKAICWNTVCFCLEKSCGFMAFLLMDWQHILIVCHINLEPKEFDQGSDYIFLSTRSDVLSSNSHNLFVSVKWHLRIALGPPHSSRVNKVDNEFFFHGLTYLENKILWFISANTIEIHNKLLFTLNLTGIEIWLNLYSVMMHHCNMM